MKPRRHIFHHSEPPPPPQASAYHRILNQSANQALSSSETTTMAPPPLPTGSGQPSNQSQSGDFMAELIRLGMNPNDMSSGKQSSSSRPQGQEELLKNLQVLLGKRDVAELLQKLQPNDWPAAAQSSDYTRPVGGGGSSNSGNPPNRDSVIRGPGAMYVPSSGVSGGGPLSFTNNNLTNNGNSSQQEQDLQYPSAQQHHQQTSASTINHHQQFRAPTNATSSATNMQNPPFMRNHQQHSLSQHSKSVLSLHHQQQQQQQNDPTYRQRLTHQHQMQHKMNAAPNLSFANLNDLSGGGVGNVSVPSTSVTAAAALAAAASGSSSSTMSDTSNTPSIFSHQANKTSPALSSYTIASGSSVGSGMAPRAPTNLMDALSGSAAGSASVSGNSNGPTPGIDINMHDSASFHLTSSILNNNRENMKQKSMARHHQQLRGQLKTQSDKLKNYPWPNQQGVSSSSLSHGSSVAGDLSTNQHPRSNNNTINTTTNNNSSNNNSFNNPGQMHSQMRRQLTSPLASAISPPQAHPPSSSSVPKSLLNLAAFSSSPPTTNNINTVTSNVRMTSQQQQAHRNPNHANQTYGSTSGPNNRQSAAGRGNNTNAAVAPCSLINKSSPSSSGDPNHHLLQQMIARTSNSKTSTSVASAPRTNYSNYSLTSLLSDDQSASIRNNAGTSNSNCNQFKLLPDPTNTIARMPSNSSHQTISRRPPSAKSDDAATAISETRKDIYIAHLQERAAKAGVSIGEIGGGQTIDIYHGNPQQQSDVASSQSQQRTHELLARRDIEAALNQVDHQNDLSLLNPSVTISSNSQKQINSLSAGLQLTENADILTDELKKIVQDGCNIIYECKTCCNLFRSLANLVKHKRSFCKDEEPEAKAHFELTRRANMNALQSVDLSVTKSHQGYGPVRAPTASREVDQIRTESQPVHAHNTRSASHQYQQQQAQVQPAPSLGSQKYNLRGKRVDVSALTGEMRAPRMPPRASQDPRNMRNQPLASLPDGRQTNLSRLLQSQPRNRPPQVKDSALMDALSVGSGGSAVPRDSRVKMGDLYQDHVRNSSLAKTLLSESAKSMNVAQAHMMSAARESNSNTQSKRLITPKRKSLEECLKKVKRDKIGPDDGPTTSVLHGASNPGTSADRTSNDQDQFRDPLDMDDSGADSDALVMDLDESYSANAHESRRISHNRSQTRASSDMNTASRLKSSSALLKALTRPVESKPNYGPTSAQLLGENLATNQQARDSAVRKLPSKVSQADEQATSDPQSDNEKTSQVESADVSKIERPSAAFEAKPASPLFSSCFCDVCNKNFSNPTFLIEHIFAHHPKENYIYPCIFCSLSFITLENVCRHMVDIHKKSRTQVSKLKDVVQSRSFASDNLDNCDDIPAEFKSAPFDSNTPKEVQQLKLRLSPGSLSDSATTQQILDDTVALVSMAASPTKAAPLTSPHKRTSGLATRSSTRLLNEPNEPRQGVDRATREVSTKEEDQMDAIVEQEVESERGSPNGLEVDDRLSDSMIPSISDEQLAILEREEAEIEAERLRREGDTGGTSECSSPSKQAARGGSQGDDEVNAEEQSALHREHGRSLAPTAPSSQDEVDRSDLEQDSSIQESASSCDSQAWRDEYNQAGRKRNSGKAMSLEDANVKLDDDNENEDSHQELESEPGDTQSTRDSYQRGRVSRGKQMVPPMRRAAEEDEEDEDEEDEDEEDEDEEDEDDDEDEEGQAEDEDDDEQAEVDSEAAAENEDNWPMPGERYDPDSNSASTSPSGLQDDAGSDDEDNDDDDDDDNDDGDSNERVELRLSGHRSSRLADLTSPKRRSSHGSSTKGDMEHPSFEANDKAADYNHHDGDAIGSHQGSSKISSRTPDLKAKLKCTTRDAPSGGPASSASSSSGGASGGVTPGSGGIMKLKIQLKKQPDEKSKVYRIVE